VLRREEVDLVLVDQHVGDARGIDLLDRLRRDDGLSQIPAILTVGREAGDAPAGVMALVKPFTPAQLRSAMLRVLAPAGAEAG
jgi:CheY-like chemotaxis protein